MENKDSQMIRDYMNLMESTEKKILSESIITPLLTQTFKGFSKSVSRAVENSLRTVIDDVVLKSTGKVVAMNAIKNNANWKQAIIQSVEEAARARHQMSFADLSKKLPNDADKLVSEIDTILKKELDDAAKTQGKAISKDVASTKIELQKTQTAKAAGTATKEDLKIATKNWNQNVKLQAKIKDAKRVLAGMPATTRKEVDKILKQAKTSKTTGTQVSTSVKPGGKSVQLPVSQGGGIFKLTKEQLSKLTGPITKVVLSKGIVKSLTILGVSVGVVYLIYQAMFPNDSIIIEDENGNDVDFGGNEFGPCVQDLITKKSATIVANDGGEVYALVQTTGSEEYDKVGGLKFYANGKVMTSDGSKTGTWSCKEGKTEIKELSLNEQGGEIDSATMQSYVDTAVDDLDGWVDSGNLSSLKTILTNLKGKTFNGKDAISEFLKYYKADESGDDFAADVESVGVKTVGVQGINDKEEILNLVKGGGSSPAPTVGNLDGIDIKWDTDKKDDGGNGGGKKPSIYKECKDFPYMFGCKSDIIKEVQICLGMESKYQTGNFGEVTLKYLETKRGEKEITKEVYDSIKANCSQKVEPLTGDTVTGNTVTVTGDTVTPTPSPVTPTPTPGTGTPSSTTGTPTGESGGELYARLNADGILGPRKFQKSVIVYKGPDLSKEEMDKLRTYLEGRGFRLSRFDNDYKKGDKLVFKKQPQPEA